MLSHPHTGRKVGNPVGFPGGAPAIGFSIVTGRSLGGVLESGLGRAGQMGF